MGMQTKRTATARKSAANARKGARRATLPAVSPGPAKRRIGITGPGQRRVPSLIALKGAKRHSRMVRTMRVLLPALALLVIGLVTLQALMYRADDTLKLSFAESGSIADDLKMVKPELSFPFGDGNRFRATAGDAYQAANTPSQVIMRDIQADFAMGSGSWFNLSAPKGIVDTKAGDVTLGGGIDFFSDLGYELHTKSVKINARDGTLTGPSEVTGQGPAGTLRAERFSVLKGGKLVRFEGKVRMEFTPPSPPSG